MNRRHTPDDVLPLGEAEQRMMRAYDVFEALLHRRPAAAQQLAAEVAELAKQFEERYPNRRRKEYP